jgi:hypothetical protein
MKGILQKTLYNIVRDALEYRGFSQNEAFEIIKHLLKGSLEKKVFEIIRKMPFGRYRGMLLTELYDEHQDYLDWLLRLENVEWIDKKYPWLIPYIREMFE